MKQRGIFEETKKSRSQNNNRIAQVFEYLLSVKNKELEVKRDVFDYSDKIWWESEMPLGKGCYIYGNGLKEDAWLEVYKQDIPDGPSLSCELKDWVQYDAKNPLKKTVLLESRKENENLIFLKDQEGCSEIIKIHESWHEDKWKKWSSAYSHPYKVQKLYDQLFYLYQRIQREEEDLEINWGHGLFLMEKDSVRIRRHIITTRLTLNFDSKKGIFFLIPTNAGSVIEKDMLLGLELPHSNVFSTFEAVIEETGIDPRINTGMEELFRDLINRMSTNGKISYDVLNGKISDFKDYPVIFNSPALFVRKGSGLYWQKDLERIAKSIREGIKVPGHIIDLITTQSREPDEAEKHAWSSIGENLLFPLPANEEQKEVAKKLSRHHGVVVQGPPGTGKSYTIANLISHLLAHGKRILVTSQTVKALKVLEDKIPQEIRPLCVSVFDGNAEGKNLLESSINEISTIISTADRDEIKSEIDKLENNLYSINKKQAELTNDLKDCAKRECEKIIIGEREYTPSDLWMTVEKERGKFQWLTGNIDINQEMPLSDTEIRELYDLLKKLSLEDRVQLSLELPDINKLPLSSFLERHFENLKNYEKECPEKSFLKSWIIPENLNINFTTIFKKLDIYANILENLKKTWVKQVLEDSCHGGNRKDMWREFYNNCKTLVDNLYRYDRELSMVKLVVPESLTTEEVKEILDKHQKFEKIGFLSRLLKRKTWKQFETCLINDEKIKDINDVKLIYTWKLRETETKKLYNLWTNRIVQPEGQKPEIENPGSLGEFEENLDIIKQAVFWHENITEQVIRELDGIKFPEDTNWSSISWYKTLKEGLKTLEDEKKLLNERLGLEETRKYLESGMEQERSSRSWRDLLEALDKRDVISWNKCIEKLQTLSVLKPDYEKMMQLYCRLALAAPYWGKYIWCSKENVELAHDIDFQKAWNWAKAETLMEKITHLNTDSIHDELAQLKKEQYRTIEKLVAQKTWLSQLDKITVEQKRALNSWVQFIKKLGKGAGKYADKHRKNAREQMAICRNAIPVWIMPLNRVIENFEPDTDKFDVIIFDESSQCNIFAISALFRARRAIIVGDENQISPQAVGIDQSSIHSLMENYLERIPNKNIYDLQTSIYDVAKIVFPGAVMLREHFRCVPEIIEFSNRLMYNGQIIPLRKITSDYPIKPAVEAVFVRDGFRHETRKTNRPEAEAIVKEISRLCKDPVYHDKTMGVISLLGKDQAVLIEDLLIESPGTDEMLRRNLVCGDAYSFQGDERDIIFLSMVAANNTRTAPLTRLSDYQRFNVAASRARDQVKLFYSIDRDDLSPRCVRRLLLDYYLDPGVRQKSLSDYEHLFESKFEKDVFMEITSKGFRVEPQVKVGRYRIDMVVEGQLAVECDGDRWHGMEHWEKDLERQNILERAGWPFWRIRASTFYKNRTQSLEPLWKKNRGDFREL
jgi:very-short-patch-repair endonuclease